MKNMYLIISIICIITTNLVPNLQAEISCINNLDVKQWIVERTEVLKQIVRLYGSGKRFGDTDIQILIARLTLIEASIMGYCLRDPYLKSILLSSRYSLAGDSVFAVALKKIISEDDIFAIDRKIFEGRKFSNRR